MPVDTRQMMPRLSALLASLLSWGLLPASSGGRDLQVDPDHGDDASSSGPLKTISRAISLAKPGDTIHLRPLVYRDYAGFFGKRGEPGKPITLDGHGATLEGSEPLDPGRWREIKPGLFRCDDLLRHLDEAIIHRWFFLWNGRMNRMGRFAKGKSAPLKKPGDLKAGEWTFVKDAAWQPSRAQQIGGSFYLKLAPGRKLADEGLFVPTRSAGVQFAASGTRHNAHLVIRNLTATHAYNDGFNIHGHCEDVRFENIRAVECGDDGISAHETAQYRVDGLVSIGNATGLCDTGSSETHYRNVLIRDCGGFDLYFIGLRHSLENAVIESGAARAFWLDGRHLPEGKRCQLTMKNVLLRRVGGGPQEMRIGSGGVLRAEHCSIIGLDMTLTPGAESYLQYCLLAGAARPNVILFNDTVWGGRGNLYDLKTLRVGQTSFRPKTFADFQRLTGSETDSRWETAPAATNIGADRESLKHLHLVP